MTVTIGYDATAAVHQGAGIGRYARQLLEALARRDDDFRYRVVYCGPGARAGGLPALDRRFRRRAIPASDRVMNAIWHRLRLPLPVQLFAGRFDLFHSPDFTLPPDLGKPTVLTVHDLAFLTVPECSYPTLQAYLAATVPRSVESATHVIAVSESTRCDLISHLGVAPERVTTVLEGVSPGFRPVEDRAAAERALAAAGVRLPYILSVGTLEPRKNYVRLLEAYAAARREGLSSGLVIAGRPGWLYEPILRRIDELGLSSAVTVLQPPDGLLPALYSFAELFVYPSLYEGFGLPPLEALACGAPVACSEASSMPEVVGDAALLFDPTDTMAITAAMLRLTTDQDLRRRMASRGPARAAALTWEAAAARTVALYRSVVARA
ncbi:MAG TPA: glycosyltransferase family 1 protein [Chloroflexota bacterium]|nr:glycosyltransferase family 1 protein [Chloroflexota bacterium]